MAKLSVEKALEMLRKESPKSRQAKRAEEMEALNAETRRMRTQRLRLQHKGQSTTDAQTGSTVKWSNYVGARTALFCALLIVLAVVLGLWLQH
jgi:hypothetical protein